MKTVPELKIALGLLFLGVSAAPAFAGPPLADAKPLSEIVASVERRADFAYVDEVDWDSDGYWKVEYRSRTGADVKLRLDPLTGAERPR